MSQEIMSNIDIGIESSLELINRFKNIKNCLDEAKTNPITLLENKVFANEFDLSLFLSQIQCDFGVEGVDEFQLSYAKKVISVIKEKIPYNEVQINLDVSAEGYYYLVLSTIVDDTVYPMMFLNFYLKEIHLIPNPLIVDINEKIKEVKKEISDLEEHLSNLEISTKNPLYLAGDNSIKMMDMIIRKKKYAEEIKQSMNETIGLITDCKYKLSNYNRDLDELEMNDTRVSLFTEKYVDRLSNYFGFTVIKQTNDFTEEIEAEIDSIEKIEFEFDSNNK